MVSCAVSCSYSHLDTESITLYNDLLHDVFKEFDDLHLTLNEKFMRKIHNGEEEKTLIKKQTIYTLTATQLNACKQSQHLWWPNDIKIKNSQSYINKAANKTTWKWRKWRKTNTWHVKSNQNQCWMSYSTAIAFFRMKFKPSVE